MEFINSYVAHLNDIGILSTEDDSSENFLNKLLYSDQIEISDFDQRSVICLQQHFQQLNQQQIYDMCQKIFESWHKKQNEVIHQKLSNLFLSAELKTQLMLQKTIMKWKNQVEKAKDSNIIDKLRSQIEQLKQEVMMEREEREQYQKKLQARNQQTNQQLNKCSKELDMTQNSLKEQSQQHNTQEAVQEGAVTSSSQQSNHQQHQFQHQPMILEYTSQAIMNSTKNINNNMIYVAKKDLKESSHLQQSHANLVDSQQQVQFQTYENQQQNMQQHHHMNNYSNGSKTEFDPLGSNMSLLLLQSKSGAAAASGQYLTQQQYNNQYQSDDYREVLEKDQNLIQASPKKQKLHQQPFKQHQHVKPQGETNSITNDRLTIDRLDTPGQDNDDNDNNDNEIYHNYQHQDQDIITGNNNDNDNNMQQQYDTTYNNDIIQDDDQDIDEAIPYQYQHQNLSSKQQQQQQQSPQQLLAKELQKQSKEDRMKFILEKVIQEKFQGKVPDHLSPTQHRELEHLVSFVNKIHEETAECTFHPQINSKTKKLAEKRMPLQKEGNNKNNMVFNRLHKEGEMKRYNHTRYQEIKQNNEMIECTFSPKTNSPSSIIDKNFSPSLSINRLHYQEIQERNEKLTKKEAEKYDQFRKEYTFKPERLKTKKLDNFLVNSNKENHQNDGHEIDMYERLYRDHIEQAERLEMKRQAKAQQEIEMINGTSIFSRSKSGKKNKLNQLDFQNLSNQQHQMYSFYPQTTKSISSQNTESWKNFPNKNDHKILSPQNTNTFSSNKKLLPHYSSTISFQSNMRNNGVSSTKNILNRSNVLSSSNNNFGSNAPLSQTSSIQSTPNAFNRLYQNAQQSAKRKEKLRDTIDQELGISFSPKMFKAASKVALPSPKTTVIDRNEEFLRNKLMKIQLQEEQKYSDCTFEPQLVAKNSNKNKQSRVMQSINLHQQRFVKDNSILHSGRVSSRCNNNEMSGGLYTDSNNSNSNFNMRMSQNNANNKIQHLNSQSLQNLNNLNGAESFGNRLYQEALMQEDRKNKQRFELEQKMKQQYMKLRSQE